LDITTAMSASSNSVVEMRNIDEEPAAFLSKVLEKDKLSTMQLYRDIKSDPNISQSYAAERLTDIHSRLALPWTCLIATLFGIPAGTRTGRQGVMSAVILAIVFFFGMYALMQIGIFMGKKQILEPWLAAWFSNIVFFCIGGFMTLRLR